MFQITGGENFWLIYGIAIILSAGCVFLWGGFFYRFSSRLTTPKKLFRYSFFFGIMAMLLAFIIERTVAGLLTFNISSWGRLFENAGTADLIQSLIFAFLIVAVVEETIKFFILRKQLKAETVDQVIDGIKIGLWLGFGFAFAENTLYFSNFFSAEYSPYLLLLTIFVRGILSTLAHGIYGILMGYYLSLAKFHRLYRPHFERTALVVCVLIHGLFDFFLIYSIGAASVIMLITLLIIALVWYSDRRSLELDISMESFAENATPPFLAQKYELEALLSKNKASAKTFQKLLLWFPSEKS